MAEKALAVDDGAQLVGEGGLIVEDSLLLRGEIVENDLGTGDDGGRRFGYRLWRRLRGSLGL